MIYQGMTEQCWNLLTITVLLSMSFFNSIGSCFKYFVGPLLSAYMFRSISSFWYIYLLSLKSWTFWGSYLLEELSSNLWLWVCLLHRNVFSWKQQNVGFNFLIHPVSLSVISPLTLRLLSSSFASYFSCLVWLWNLSCLKVASFVLLIKMILRHKVPELLSVKLCIVPSKYSWWGVHFTQFSHYIPSPALGPEDFLW